MEQQVRENSKKIQSLELKNNTLENCMKFINDELKEVKDTIKIGFASMGEKLEKKDKEYNNKFATKKELETAKRLEDRGKLINNPIIWVIIVTIVATITNLFSDAILILFR